MARISIEGVTKRYSDGSAAVDNVSIEVADGEFLVLVGPSGCGKSTLLRMIAGLEDITSGAIRVDDRIVNDLPPKDRDIAMIFQTYALFPHMTVEKNLRYGLKVRGTPKAEADARVQKAAKTLGLLPLMNRRPGQLSGGQRQRVAIGRALVREPSVFLMDEPLANLDTKLRVHMRTEFARLREQLRTTTVYVTHDQVEAMTLGHRVCVLRDGVVQQIDTPDQLFARPKNMFVAGFIGSPEMNFAKAKVVGRTVTLGSHAVGLPDDVDLARHDGREIVLGIRPSDFYERADGQFMVDVELVERLGSENIVVFPVAAESVRADRIGGRASAVVDDEEALQAGQAGRTPFTARLDGTAKARAGVPLRLGVAPEALHFFDPQTGLSIGRR
ncbi:ABC transporter ATP-binding protein [Prosthecomicrobium pneumaticum]|uniref:Multiple sugar transport system ATP-binding protein n=1 Tax=Prosthecomicrobium pneumaticum TaxID=81895 RepID=A0A7W9CTG9_9HYPH|nr:sn-glycerol-3-phosphate ABC transporter ATP-binding protein UgpC [Prosthecomicrobium pneumaticum]MBB5751613.1 multiple sugar transport system ATP-binding protein [Prosthecomicrobium pneumaticum]